MTSRTPTWAAARRPSPSTSSVSHETLARPLTPKCGRAFSMQEDANGV